ncbi:Streptogrisin-B [Streptomyces sp. RB5]|uniref:Streptogrisin-B n=1 Tax=Streptomyces smaragdinus TaxID=2585196 RepID=A0A7K0CBL6_9ACTN|nr:S1 family peptidase [Streptomyces smaragdinus]MQY10783.1 Streptogrisin-B [Streptomyces smaragdinus]
MRPNIRPLSSVVVGLLLTALAVIVPAGDAVAAGAVRGGDTLYGDAGTVCRVGFNARGGTASYGIVPGHCASASSTWYADPNRTVQVGVTAGFRFPLDDFGVVRYTNPTLSYPGEVNAGGLGVVDITGAANPVVGQSLCHVGKLTGIHCGLVVSVNATVSYPEGTVTGLFRSNICSDPGDAGGPAFSGTTALGVIVGGSSGSCATYYQPIVEILAAYGLTIY